MINNLANTSKNHKDRCDEDCGISIHMLKLTAKQLLLEAPSEERNELIEIIENMPIS